MLVQSCPCCSSALEPLRGPGRSSPRIPGHLRPSSTATRSRAHFQCTQGTGLRLPPRGCTPPL
eukprot:13168257-Alexandrium_andersonii.AAC.1